MFLGMEIPGCKQKDLDHEKRDERKTRWLTKEQYDLRDGPRKEKISYEEFEVTGSKKGKTRTASSEHL